MGILSSITLSSSLPSLLFLLLSSLSFLFFPLFLVISSLLFLHFCTFSSYSSVSRRIFYSFSSLLKVVDRVCTAGGVLDLEPLRLGEGAQIKEMPVWGIDCYSRRLFHLSLSSSLHHLSCFTPYGSLITDNWRFLLILTYSLLHYLTPSGW